MARRKRGRRAEEDDDALERQYFTKRNREDQADRRSNNNDDGAADKNTSKPTECNVSQTPNSNNTSDDKDTTTAQSSETDKLQRLKEKKRLKKQRQKEKKLQAQQAAEQRQARQAQEQEQQKKALQQKQKEHKHQDPPPSSSFVTTRMGVQYCDIVVGKGPAVVDRKPVRVKYVLRAKHAKGKIIDRSGHFGFRLGKGEVISGWDIGLVGMKQGGTRHIIVPPQAGYGQQDIGGGTGANLYFEVTLLHC